MKNYMIPRQEITPAIFDIGNVLYHVDIDKFTTFMSEHFQVSKERAEEILVFIQPLQDLGQCNIVSGLKPFFPNGDYDKVKKRWLEIIWPSSEMIALVESAIKDRHEVAILSNMGQDHVQLIRSQLPQYILDNVEIYFSCELGMRKPMRSTYKAVSELWKPISHRYILFFDDRQENLDAAEDYFVGQLFDLDRFSTDSEAARYVQACLTPGYL